MFSAMRTGLHCLVLGPALLLEAAALVAAPHRNSLVKPSRISGDCRNCPPATALFKEEAALGFPSRPPPHLWGARLREITEAARGDPCGADKIALAYDRPVGFGSRVNSFVDEIFYAMYGNFSLAVCAGLKEGFYNKVWSRLFVDPLDIPVCDKTGPWCGDVDPDEVWPMWPGIVLSQGMAHRFPSYLIRIKRFLSELVLLWKPETQRIVAENLRQVGLTDGTSYVGIHIRRGDKVVRETLAVPVSAYTSEAQRYFRESSNTTKACHTAFIASDDRFAADKVQAALGPGTRVLHQNWSAGVASRSYNDTEEVLRLLTDLEALRRSDLFIGTATSNVGRLVYILRGGIQRPCLNVDPLGHWLQYG